MPRYVYYCESCEQVFEQAHSIKIKLEDCRLCTAQDSLKRLPSTTRTIKIKQHNKQRPGQVIKKHIEEAKEDIDRDKKERVSVWES
tara:strand:+ start:424 stop:681 length:258 start_codon:yes stop_codon:yes gene_type:complete